jgi:hypothetical protein
MEVKSINDWTRAVGLVGSVMRELEDWLTDTPSWRF